MLSSSLVPHDAREPRCRAIASTQCPLPAPGTQKRLLSDVLGLIRAGVAAGQAEAALARIAPIPGLIPAPGLIRVGSTGRSVQRVYLSETLLSAQRVYREVTTPTASLGVKETFEQIAPFYDRFTAHHNYEAWLQSLLHAARKCGLRGNRVLDVGCGTGKSFLPLLARGWEVTACDISEGMLLEAARKTGERARLEVADMRALPVFGSFDLVLCLDDAVNYLSGPGELESCFAGLRRNAAAGGLVLFDVNTLLTYRTFYSETQVQETDGYRMIWRGRADGDARPGGRFEATFEVVPTNGHPAPTASAAVHRQRHFRPREVVACLAHAGLECVAIYGHGFDGRLQSLDEAIHTKAIFIGKPI